MIFPRFGGRSDHAASAASVASPAFAGASVVLVGLCAHDKGFTRTKAPGAALIVGGIAVAYR